MSLFKQLNDTTSLVSLSTIGQDWGRLEDWLLVIILPKCRRLFGESIC